MPEEPLLCVKGNDPGGNQLYVFAGGITLVSASEEKHYPLSGIEDAFLTLEPDSYEKIVVIDAIDKSQRVHLKLYERDFPGLHEAMGQALESGWGGFYEKRNVQAPIMWFHAVCATNAIFSESNPFIYAFKVKNPEFAEAERERVSSVWGLSDRDSLISEMSNLIGNDDGLCTKWFTNHTMSEPAKKRVENAIAAIVMSKAMSLALDGYSCDWLSYEESLSWCLVAGNNLQETCSDWDSYAQCMLDSYDLLIHTPFVPSQANYKCKALQASYRCATEHLSQLPENPRKLPWFTSLEIDTGPAINTEMRTLPSDFQYMPELRFTRLAFLSDSFKMFLGGFVESIESGECSFIDLTVHLHISICSLFVLMNNFCVDDELVDKVTASCCATIRKIFRFYAVAMDVHEIWRMHTTPNSEEDSDEV
ncbi:MAG: DUF1266 domain-containing protein [Clostridiales bacterium]|jgi:hypothetical protein|nr:DUF1266 domain-containing protein [Clostridiales bacterium]